MWKMFYECFQLESWIRLFLKFANQIVFLILFVRYMHRIFYGTTNWNSLWKSLTVVCCTLLANYCIWPLFLHATQVLVSHHSFWTLAILLMTFEWISNRWFTSNEDQPIVPLQESQQCLSEQSNLQGDVSERINSGNSDEADDVDVESLDQAETMSKATQTHDLPPIQVKTNTLPTESITEQGSLASFNASQNIVEETSRRTASNLSTVSNLMSITTRSGRKYYKN